MVTNLNKLIADISLKCIESGISFRLENATHVDTNNLPCSGYFDEKVLAVAIKKKDPLEWIMTLIHEACHMDQWIEGVDTWIPDKYSIEIVEDWIHGKKLTPKKVQKGFNNAIRLELDCERRSIAKAQTYQIPINTEKYIQQANAYLFSYVYTFHTKKWYKSPYEKTKIWKNMPTTFLTLDQYFSEYFKYESHFS